MKKPIIKPPERECPQCAGSGFAVAKDPSRPEIRIYQDCKECLGKGRIAAN
jgi:DnaJ-class molecular chaperone